MFLLVPVDVFKHPRICWPVCSRSRRNTIKLVLRFNDRIKQLFSLLGIPIASCNKPFTERVEDCCEFVIRDCKAEWVIDSSQSESIGGS